MSGKSVPLPNRLSSRCHYGLAIVMENKENDLETSRNTRKHPVIPAITLLELRWHLIRLCYNIRITKVVFALTDSYQAGQIRDRKRYPPLLREMKWTVEMQNDGFAPMLIILSQKNPADWRICDSLGRQAGAALEPGGFNAH